MAEGPHVAEVERWRAGRLAALTGPSGWLTVVGLHWLDEGVHSIGSGDGSDLRLAPDRAPADLGAIEVDADRVTFLPLDASVTLEGRPVTEPLELTDDGEGSPTILEVGSLRMYVIRRMEDRRALRVRDLESPARRTFHGIEHFPVDARWRFEATFEPYEPPRISRVPTVLDSEEVYPTPGALAFDHEGETYRLDAFLEHGETDLFVIFADGTTGRDTYGGGRYLYTKPADDRGIVALDFNRAYNPPCVFTAHATCALPLPQNRLPFRVEAGEKRYE
jgi:uncharacterized protein (DUF1684 family)